MPCKRYANERQSYHISSLVIADSMEIGWRMPETEKKNAKDTTNRNYSRFTRSVSFDRITETHVEAKGDKTLYCVNRGYAERKRWLRIPKKRHFCCTERTIPFKYIVPILHAPLYSIRKLNRMRSTCVLTTTILCWCV